MIYSKDELLDLNLLIEGKYQYYHWETNYAQEHFKLYQDDSNGNLFYSSEVNSRMPTGEFLKILVKLNVTRHYIPLELLISKSIGKQLVEEHYFHDQKVKSMQYSFVYNEKKKKVDLTCPARFMMAGPDIVTSVLFLGLKKYDAASKNFYNILYSSNLWSYQKRPRYKTVLANKREGTFDFFIKDIQYKGQRYEIFSEKDPQVVGEKPVNAFVSSFFLIPFRISGPDGTRIEISFFKHYSRPAL